MKMLNRISICPLIIFVGLLFFAGFCSKDEDEDKVEGRITDIDGNIYRTVIIGNQIWMGENLKATKLNDGTDIPFVAENGEWESLSTPGHCWYDNENGNKNTYGGLYNWYTINTRKLCPSGWHVPSDNEWTILTTFLGGENVAGGILKEKGTTHWSSPNTGAIDKFGFTAVPGGGRNYSGEFMYIGLSGLWWSSSESSIDKAWSRDISNLYSGVGRGVNGKRAGFSVRCLKD